jgi:hypothetical protein
MQTAATGKGIGVVRLTQREPWPAPAFLAEIDVPVPLAVDFPFPACATRPSERETWAGVDEGPSVPKDPFQAIPGARDDPPTV